MMKRALSFILFFWVLVIGVPPGQATMRWRPAEAAQERIYEITGQDITELSLPVGRFEDIRTRIQKSAQAMNLGERQYPPEQLSLLAWEALEERDITKVEAAASWCLEIYGVEARNLQAEFEADDYKYLTAVMTTGLTTMRPLVYVGEVLLALGEAYHRAGREEEAVIVYEEIIRSYYLSASERR